MPITGSTLAPLQARFGIARFGAARFGSYFPSLLILLDGVDVTRKVDLASLAITDHRDDQPNEAGCEFLDDVSVGGGQALVISVGSARTCRLFSGTVLTVVQGQARASDRVRYGIRAKDSTWLLDRRLVNRTWQNISATTAVLDLMAESTFGFTTRRVALDLPTIDFLAVVNARVSAVLNAIRDRVPGAHWKVDASRDLEFGTTSVFQNPTALTSSHPHFWNLRVEREWSQIRTRVFVEGKRTRCPLAVPAGAASFPIADVFAVDDLVTRVVRIGTERIAFADINAASPAAFLALGAEGGVTTLQAAASAGATALRIVPWTGAGPTTNAPYWVEVSGMTIRYDSVDVVSGAPTYYELQGIPATGYGSLPSDVDVAAAVVWLDGLFGIDPTAIRVDQPADADVVAYVQVDDSTSQTAVAGVEGGDGVHETVRDAPQLPRVGLTEVGAAEILAFKDELLSLTYSTRDPQTMVGRDVDVTLGGDTNVAGTFPIQEVTITGFDQLAPRTSRAAAAFPIRDVIAATTARQHVVDLILTPIPLP